MKKQIVSIVVLSLADLGLLKLHSPWDQFFFRFFQHSVYFG